MTTVWAVASRVLNYVTIALCSVSLTLCARSLVRAWLLRKEAEQFFRDRLEWTMTLAEKVEFLNAWSVSLCFVRNASHRHRFLLVNPGI